MQKKICEAVDQSNWNDLVSLFESRGAPHYCWCMLWRNMSEGCSRKNKTDKKKSLKDYVDQKLPVGLLCYHLDMPVAWCSVAPKQTFRKMTEDSRLNDVWSIVCFFIKRPYRKKGLMTQLVLEAENYARERGGVYMEVYPADTDSPSYQFMGSRPLFEKLGYTFSEKIGERRNLMHKKL